MSGLLELRDLRTAQNATPPTGIQKRRGLTQAEVKRLFDYKNGQLIWRVLTGKKTKIGDVAGTINSKYYAVVVIKKLCYQLHQVIWLWHHGYLSENTIDHIDRIKTNNKIENLREVSYACNMRNSKQAKNNTSGVKGVSFCNRDRKWVVRIKVLGKSLNVGASYDFTEAVAHRLAAEQFLNWESCDNNSPAYQHMRKYINDNKTATAF